MITGEAQLDISAAQAPEATEPDLRNREVRVQLITQAAKENPLLLHFQIFAFFVGDESDKAIGYFISNNEVSYRLTPSSGLLSPHDNDDLSFPRYPMENLSEQVKQAVRIEIQFQREKKQRFVQDVINSDPAITDLYQYMLYLRDLTTKERGPENKRMYTSAEAEIRARESVAITNGLGTQDRLSQAMADIEEPDLAHWLKRSVLKTTQAYEQTESPFSGNDRSIKLIKLLEEANKTFIQYFEETFRKVVLRGGKVYYRMGPTPADKKQTRVLEPSDLSRLRIEPTIVHTRAIDTKEFPVLEKTGGATVLKLFLDDTPIFLSLAKDTPSSEVLASMSLNQLRTMIDVLSITHQEHATLEDNKEFLALSARKKLLEELFYMIYQWLPTLYDNPEIKADQFAYTELAQSRFARLHSCANFLPIGMERSRYVENIDPDEISVVAMMDYMQTKLVLEGDEKFRKRGDYGYMQEGDELPFTTIRPLDELKKKDPFVQIRKKAKEIFADFNLRQILSLEFPVLGLPDFLPRPINLDFQGFLRDLLALGFKPDMVIKAHPIKHRRQLMAIKEVSTFTEVMELNWEHYEPDSSLDPKEGIEIISRTPLIGLDNGKERFIKVFAPQYAKVMQVQLFDNLGNSYQAGADNDFVLNYDQHAGYYRIVLTKKGQEKVGSGAFQYTITIHPDEQAPGAPTQVEKLSFDQLDRAFYVVDALEKAGFGRVAEGVKKYLVRCQKRSTLPTTRMLAAVIHRGSRYSFKQDTGREFAEVNEELAAEQSGLVGMLTEHTPEPDAGGTLAGQCVTQNYVAMLAMEFIFDKEHTLGDPYVLKQKNVHLSAMLNAYSFTFGLRGMAAVGFPHADTRARIDDQAVTHDVTGSMFNLRTILEAIQTFRGKKKEKIVVATSQEEAAPITPESPIDETPETAFRSRIAKLMTALSRSMYLPEAQLESMMKYQEVLASKPELLLDEAADVAVLALEQLNVENGGNLPIAQTYGHEQVTVSSKLMKVLSLVYAAGIQGLSFANSGELVAALQRKGVALHLDGPENLQFSIRSIAKVVLRGILTTERHNYEQFKAKQKELFELRKQLAEHKGIGQEIRDPRSAQLERDLNKMKVSFPLNFQAVLETAWQLDKYLDSVTDV